MVMYSFIRILIFCGKIGLLCSGSRSQQRFKMPMNVCPDDIFWTTEHFVTNLAMVMQHHEPVSCGKKLLFAVIKMKVKARAHVIKIWLFLLYLLNCWFLCNVHLDNISSTTEPFVTKLVTKKHHQHERDVCWYIDCLSGKQAYTQLAR